MWWICLMSLWPLGSAPAAVLVGGTIREGQQFPVERRAPLRGAGELVH